MGSNLSRKWISLSTVFIVVSCIGTFSAAANPGTPHELTTTAGFSSGILIVLNFLMNLFYFAMALLALLLIYEGRGLNPGGISKDRAKFFFRVILTAIVITISGGIIDAYLVYQSGATMRLVFDAVRWIAAVLLVFAVTYLSAAYIVRASARLSIFPASVLALINPVSWWLNSVSISMILLPVTFIVALFFVPILLMGLGAWHGRFSGENLAAVSEEEPEISRSRARSRRKGMALVGVSILIAVITFLSAISLALTAQWYDEGRSHQGPTILYVGLREPITTLNPLLGSWETDLVFESYVYDRLTTLDDNMSIGPDLAESWWHMDGQTAASLGSNFVGLAYSDPDPADWPDGSIWEFNLTENTYWSDGWPFTADDVVFTLSHVYGKHVYHVTFKFDDQAKWIDHFEKVSEHKVRIFFSDSSYEPVPVTWGNSLRIPILPKHVLENRSTGYMLQNWTGAPTVGTGPFMGTPQLTPEFASQESVTLVKNPYYDFTVNGSRLGLGGHYNRTIEIDKLVMRFYSEEQVLVVDLKTQKLDMARTSMPNYLALQADGNRPMGMMLVNVTGLAGRAEVTHLNVLPYASASERLNPARLDPALLRAVALATNRSYICDNIFKGLATPGVGILSPVWSQYHWSPPHDENSTFEFKMANGTIYNYTKPLDEVMAFDLDLANDILDAAGYVWTDSTHALRKVGTDAAERLHDLFNISTSSSLNKTLEFEDVYWVEDLEDTDISRYLMEAWADIGVKVAQKPVNAGIWNQLVYGFQYNLTESSWVAGMDPTYLMYIPTSEAMTWLNEFGTINATYDDYYDELVTEFNATERQHWLDECQKWQYLAGGAMIFTAYPKSCYAYNDADNGSGQWTGWTNLSLHPESAFDSTWPENPLFWHLKWLGYTVYADSSTLAITVLAAGFGGLIAVAIGAILYFRQHPERKNDRP